MARKLKVTPISKKEGYLPVTGLEELGDVCLISGKSTNVGELLFALISKDLKGSKKRALIPVEHVSAVSFDGQRWFAPSENVEQPDREADDDAGPMMKLDFAFDLTRWADGKFTTTEFEKHIRQRGIPRKSISDMLFDRGIEGPGSMGLGKK